MEPLTGLELVLLTGWTISAILLALEYEQKGRRRRLRAALRRARHHRRRLAS